MVRQPYTIEHALLGLIRNHPMHGYDIFLRLSKPEGLGLIWKLKQSQLYALLDRLAESGYLSSHVEPQMNHPSRVIFSITDPGTFAFERWVASPIQHPRQFRLEFLAKYYFALDQPVQARHLLTAQREMGNTWLARLTDHPEEKVLESSFEQAVNSYRIVQIQSILTWLDSELARLPIR